MAQTINSIYFTWMAPGGVHCPFGLGFCMPLRMGNGRRAVGIRQCRGARLDAGSCLKATRTAFGRKTRCPQKPKCSAWSDLGGSPVALLLRPKESWMLAGNCYSRAPGRFCPGPTTRGGCFLCCRDTRAHDKCPCTRGSLHVGACMPSALLTGLNRLLQLSTIPTTTVRLSA